MFLVLKILPLRVCVRTSSRSNGGMNLFSRLALVACRDAFWLGQCNGQFLW